MAESLGGLELPDADRSAEPVEGHEFLLMAGVDGGPLPRALLDRTGLLVELEGEIEQRDDLLIFRVDTSGKDGMGS